MLERYIRAKLWLDDRGAITTETAIVTALLALAAGGIIAIITTRATDWANAIPGP